MKRPALAVLGVLLLQSCALTDRMALLRQEKACVERIINGEVPKGCEAHADRYHQEEEEAIRAAEKNQALRAQVERDREVERTKDPRAFCLKEALIEQRSCRENAVALKRSRESEGHSRAAFVGSLGRASAGTDTDSLQAAMLGEKDDGSRRQRRMEEADRESARAQDRADQNAEDARADLAVALEGCAIEYQAARELCALEEAP